MTITCGTSTSAVACNIPVFRYALERWKPDQCEVLVFHDGGLRGGDAEVVRQLHRRSSESNGHANVKVVSVDITDQTLPEQAELWSELQRTSDSTLPHVVIRTKIGRGRFVNHWHGTLDEASRLSLFESPARTEIRDRLLAGHSVVWLLLRSSAKDKGDAAKAMLEGTFESLTKSVQLPEGIGLPGSELYAEIPLILKFSVLEVDTNDPNEKLLRGLLTGLRQKEYDDGEPLLVPIFGRGRALEVIPASDLSANLVKELTVFLSGACSCQVKEQNPGFDLLLEVDWDGELFGGDEHRPPDRSADEGQNRSPTLVPIPPGRK